MSAALALRHVGAGVAAHWRRLARRRDSMPFDWMDSSWQLQLRPLLEQRSGLTVLQIEWGGTPVLIKFDESWLQQVSREVLQVDDLRAVPDVLRPMVIEAACEGLASLSEGATRKRFSLLKIDPEPAIRPACPHGVALLLENGDTEIEGEIWLDDTGLGYAHYRRPGTAKTGERCRPRWIWASAGQSCRCHACVT